jgi:adenylate cyclase
VHTASREEVRVSEYSSETSRTSERPRPAQFATAGPDRRAAAIMFTDLERFTETIERLGDVQAHQLLMTHNMLIRARVTSHKGRELKTMGDGFLVVFPSVVQAVACAAAIQADIADHNEHNDEQLHVRIGIHAGGVIRNRDDVHGRNVVFASRIAALARGGEVVVSSAVRNVAEASGRFTFCDGRSANLPGITGEHTVYTLR